MLNNSIGVLLYLILRNDLSWALLSSQEKKMILEVNQSFNTGRDDYASPALYGQGRIEGGENWDSTKPRDITERGRALHDALALAEPQKVLEIGPGPGFFSKVVCAYHSVKEYVAIDIGQGFLDYLRPRLEALRPQKSGFRFELLQGELKNQAVGGFHLILLLSCVHHIPDRAEFFADLEKRLNPGGYIFCFDPSHYLVRWLRLLKASVTQGYLRRDFFLRRENLSTHHFCTIGEYRAILKKLPSLELVREFYEPANRVKKLPFLARLFPRLFSVEMGVLLRKRNEGGPA